MRVLFMYHEYYDRRKRYAKILKGLGHHVTAVDVQTKMNRVTVDRKHLRNVDCVFALNMAYAVRKFRPWLVDECEKRGIPIFSYSTVPTEVTPERAVEIGKPFTYLFEHTPEVVDILKKTDPDHAGKYVHVSHGFHPEHFYPRNLEKKLDISFGGHSQRKHGKRTDYLKALMESQSVVLYGKSLCKRMGVPIREYSTPKEDNKRHNSSKLCVNLPYYDSWQSWLRKISAPNDRFFEIPASGSIQLTEYSPYLAAMFEPDKECFYFRDVNDMRSSADYIVKHSDELNGVRRAARERAMDEHTYAHRLKKIMEIVQG